MLSDLRRKIIDMVFKLIIASFLFICGCMWFQSKVSIGGKLLRSPCLNKATLDTNQRLVFHGRHLTDEYNGMELECMITISSDERPHDAVFGIYSKGVNFSQNSLWSLNVDSIDSITVNRPGFGVFESIGELNSDDTLTRTDYVRIKKGLTNRVLDILGKGDFVKFSTGIVINTETEKIFNLDKKIYVKNIVYAIVDNFSYRECDAFYMDDKFVYYPN